METHVIVAIAAAVFLGAGGGLLTPIDGWYRALRKPSWQPPDWAFGPIWTTILGLWAWSAIRAWEAVPPDDQWRVWTLFGVNAVFHFLWTPLFFKARRPDWSLIEVIFLWASVVALIVGLLPRDALAAWLHLPYLIWVSIAAYLNLTIVRLNQPFGTRVAGN